ncbi:STAS domain-containing protein [Streptomyces rubrogriseus]|uniref:STAS domain-containing protein n=1 Tax=Streptomyces rubrogriseus TaxID=194673 RepID=A0A6G3TK06_9ACTN|nr:STAS domain-containing protein [Streptomyces rubrogriseus]MYS76374.1 STAS domain-containing protein [Streptomyces sp. SID5926]NEC36923.1 STAS domain-containing protein [Streptomyces rubrogriseus]
MTFLPQPCEPCEPGEPPGCVVLAMPGEIDFCNAAGLLPLIMTAVEQRSDGLRLLVLDLSPTSFMDSQGVRLVAAVRRRLPDHVPLRVVAVPKGVPSRVLELSNLRRDVPVHDNLAEALRTASGIAGSGTAGSGTAA